jgi:hypothetical protein
VEAVPRGCWIARTRLARNASALPGTVHPWGDR